MPLKILLNGAKGRMGQAIHSVAAECDAQIAAAVDIKDDPAADAAACDVFIDFSVAQATPALAAIACEHRKPLVIGATGHSADEQAAIGKAAKIIPIVWSGNYATGVNLLFYLATQAARRLDASYHPEVIELHHQFKKDAPSGTARNLIDLISEARGLSPEQECHGRTGLVGERPTKQIGVHAVRGGDIVGDHTVLFAGPGERLELTHRASDRTIFARGALRAAHWVVQNQPPGIYSMQDVLGLK